MKSATRRKYRTDPTVKPAKDPDVIEVRRAMMGAHMAMAEIQKNSYLSRTTLRNIITGKTMRPQNMTIVGAMKAIGFDRQWIRRK